MLNTESGPESAIGSGSGLSNHDIDIPVEASLDRKSLDVGIQTDLTLLTASKSFVSCLKMALQVALLFLPSGEWEGVSRMGKVAGCQSELSG